MTRSVPLSKEAAGYPRKWDGPLARKEAAGYARSAACNLVRGSVTAALRPWLPPLPHLHERICERSVGAACCDTLSVQPVPTRAVVHARAPSAVQTTPAQHADGALLDRFRCLQRSAVQCSRAQRCEPHWLPRGLGMRAPLREREAARGFDVARPRCTLPVAWRTLHAACYTLYVACCVLRVAFVARCVLQALACAAALCEAQQRQLVGARAIPPRGQ